MRFQHKELASGRWQRLSLAEQLANIGSEVSRAIRWQKRDERFFWNAVQRSLELFYLTIADSRWKDRLKEITRIREIFCDAVLGGREYGSKLEDIEKYLFYFALYCQKNKRKIF